MAEPAAKTTESLNGFAPVIAVVGFAFMLMHAGLGLTSLSIEKENSMSQSQKIVSIQRPSGGTTAGQIPAPPPPARPSKK